jgi:hypothetical protein
VDQRAPKKQSRSCKRLASLIAVLFAAKSISFPP